MLSMNYISIMLEASLLNNLHSKCNDSFGLCKYFNIVGCNMDLFWTNNNYMEFSLITLSAV